MTNRRVELAMLVVLFGIGLGAPAWAGDDLDPREVAGQEYDLSAARWIVREDVEYEGRPGQQFYGYVKKVLREQVWAERNYNSLIPIHDEDNLKIGVVNAVRCRQFLHNGEARTGLAKIFLGAYSQEITQVMVRLKREQESLHLQVLTRTGRRSGTGSVVRRAEDSGRGQQIASQVAEALINTDRGTVNPSIRFPTL